jgi:DNA-binding response OmpR family regulator
MQKQKVLIIDDEPDSVETTKFILQKAGYEVYLAAEGNEGLNAFKKIKPDLVLLDILMPNVDGLEVLYMLRNTLPQSQQVPVIMLSVKKDVDTVFQAKGFGATEYITKSADPQEILAIIKKALSGCKDS